MSELLLARHGETEWSLNGRHTGTSDIPLTENGRSRARALAPRLAGRSFALVLTSPMQRAIDTCKLAGLGELAQVRDDLHEWDYGDYEGITSAEIHERKPGWSLCRDGGGRTRGAVFATMDRGAIGVVGGGKAGPSTVLAALGETANQLEDVPLHGLSPRGDRRYIEGELPSLRHVSWFLSPHDKDA